ncbi:hypothetical protein [Pectobacterium brasiliense]|uniref:hypothetical protein n=1 Tax=Pectobacterium brasiliense TaxID=180957 RepID=UPI00068D6397|nr:hypothetical protein [Pectobacterium brasiliense]
MDKNIRVTIDKASFPKKQRPYYLQLLNVNKINVNCMLIHTALWTRPPKLTGFHLADFWAWLRYIPAFSKKSNDLRLRRAWLDIDPHQKTILSDEIGVGSTTFTLINTLSFKGFVDSIYLLETLNLTHLILKKSKNGQGKTPDYIGLDGFGRIVALECKGTQNTVKDLHKAITKGIAQKKNLTDNPSGPIRMGLVGGIFIPQFHNRDNALMHFCDPDWDEFNDIISTVPPQVITKAIIRGAVIKQLYLAGANNAANELSNYVTGQYFKFSPQSIDELNSFEQERVIFNHTLQHPPKDGISHIEFTTKIDKIIFDIVNNITSIEADSAVLMNLFSVNDENFDRLQDNQSWYSYESEYGGRIITPQGFHFKLKYEINKEPAA